MSRLDNAMITSTRLGGRIRVLEQWFEETPQDVSGYDLVVHYQKSHPSPAWSCLYHYTILIDIDQPPKELLAQMKNGNAQQIRSALGKDRLSCVFFSSPTSDVIFEFTSFFNANLDPGEGRKDREDLEVLAKSGILGLSKIQAEDGATLVWHCYVCHPGQRRCRCNSSKSVKDLSGDSRSRNLLGRANRLLHYQDMLTLREMGIKWYDFGGWYPGDGDQKRANINRFKEGFGGRVVLEYECTQMVTLAGRAYFAFRLLKWALRDRELFRDYLRRRIRPEAPGPALEVPEGPSRITGTR